MSQIPVNLFLPNFDEDWSQFYDLNSQIIEEVFELPTTSRSVPGGLSSDQISLASIGNSRPTNGDSEVPGRMNDHHDILRGEDPENSEDLEVSEIFQLQEVPHSLSSTINMISRMYWKTAR